MILKPFMVLLLLEIWAADKAKALHDVVVANDAKRLHPEKVCTQCTKELKQSVRSAACLLPDNTAVRKACQPALHEASTLGPGVLLARLDPLPPGRESQSACLAGTLQPKPKLGKAQRPHTHT